MSSLEATISPATGANAGSGFCQPLAHTTLVVAPFDLNGRVGTAMLLAEPHHISPKSSQRFPAGLSVNDDVSRQGVVSTVHRPDVRVMS